MESVARIGSALVLLLVAATSPVMGWAAAEHYESRKFYAVFEGDWLFLFALIAGGSCVWSSVHILRGLGEQGR